MFPSCALMPRCLLGLQTIRQPESSGTNRELQLPSTRTYTHKTLGSPTSSRLLPDSTLISRKPPRTSACTTTTSSPIPARHRRQTETRRQNRIRFTSSDSAGKLKQAAAAALQRQRRDAIGTVVIQQVDR